MPTLQDLFSQYPRLTRKQRSILDHLREHPDEATYITLKSLAAKAGVSEVSILRLCRTLPCKLLLQKTFPIFSHFFRFLGVLQKPCGLSRYILHIGWIGN